MTDTMAAFWPEGLMDLLALQPENIDFRDIARRLSRIRRFCGGTKDPYSVAQHSVRVMDLCGRNIRPWALLHDAHEAFLSDMTSPAFAALEACCPTEGAVRVALHILRERIDAPIFRAAGLRWPSAEIQWAVHEADRQACADELAALVGVDPGLHGYPKPTTTLIRAMSDEEAERDFLAALQQCGIEVR